MLDYLKYWRVVRYFVKRKYGLSQSELEMLLFLRSEKYFSKDDFDEFDADESMLKNFVNDDEAPVFKANQARDIHRFFKAITMSVTARTRSQSPNEVPAIDFDAIEDEGEVDLDF